MRILGLDPGLRHTGWGIINTKDDIISWIASGNVSPKNSLCISERLKIIHNELNEIIHEFNPSVAAVEEVFVNMNGQSTLKLGMARYPVCSTVYYLEVEDLVDGKLQFENGVEVVPKSNRLVVFSKGFYHGVEESKGVRTSITINPWNTRLYHS